MSESTIEVRGTVRFQNRDRCPCCGTQSCKPVLESCDFESSLGAFTVHECLACGIQFTNPQPMEEDLPLLYAERDSHDFDDSKSIVDGLRRFNNLRQLRRLPEQLRESGAASLDFGCGSGFFTMSMRSFLRGRVAASDFHASCPARLVGNRDIEYITDAELDRFQGTFDLIVCRNVLEHHLHPLRLIDRLRSMLKEKGYLFIEVPNRSSAWATIFGKYYFNYYLPRHLHHFDLDALVHQLRGFRVVRFWRDHSPMLGKSLGNRLGVAVSGFAIGGILLLPVQVAIDALLRSSSQLVVLAQRQ